MTHCLPIRRFDRALIDPGQVLRGRLSKVFRHTALIEPDREGPLLTLLHPTRDLVPLGIGIPWGLVQPRTGQRAELSGRHLTIAEPGRWVRALNLVGPGVSLKLSPRQADHLVLEAQLNSLVLPERARALLDPKWTAGHDVHSQTIQMASRHLRELVTRLCQNETEARSYRELVCQLAGLGPGLTPTGDDLLVGVAAVAKQFGQMGWLRLDSLAAFQASLVALDPEITTTVGRQMLEQAAQGAFPEPLLRFVKLLGGKSRDSVEASLEAGKLSRVGASSGCDMLAGALALARALARRVPGAVP